MTDIIYPPGAAPVDGVTTTLATVVQLTAETTRATGAETTLTNGLAAEASTARAAELTNATAIASETSRATAAEGALLPLAGGTLTGALAGTTASFVGGTQTVTTDVIPAFNLSRGLSGTATNNPSLVYSAAKIVISPDSLAVSATNQFVDGLQVQHNYGSTTAMTGNRQAMQVNLVQAGTTGNTIASGHTGFYTALQTYSQASFNDNGTGLTSGTAHGRVFGASFAAQLLTGATNFYQATALELNTSVQTGAGVAVKTGLSIASVGASNVTQGTLVDAGIWFYKASGAPIKNAILIGGGGLNAYPIDPAGAYIADDTTGGTTASCAYGLHFTGAFTTASISVPGFTVDGSGNTAVGGTLGVTGTATLGQANTNTVSSTVNTSAVLFKNGPAGPIMLRVGGSAATIEADTNIVLSGGTWGSGALVNNTAGLFQNASFAGSTTSATASFGAYLQQTDNSSNTNNGIGFTEHLILNGSSVVGSRGAGLFTLDINAITGNASGKQYTALLSKANLMVTDAGAAGVYSTAFGFNSVAHIGTGVTANACCGAEINTWMQTGAVVQDRIGLQIVDVTGATFGVQATRDDVALTLNNQYGPSSTLGFEVGIGFGRAGGNFPVSTVGTLIYGQGNAGAGFTIDKGIDWSLGTATTSWLNLGGVFTVDGSGNAKAPSYEVGSNQVVGARDTGWTAMTGSPDKATAYATGSVTLAQLAGRVAQLQASMTAHGLIGA